jgi:hypothetical protein
MVRRLTPTNSHAFMIEIVFRSIIIIAVFRELAEWVQLQAPSENCYRSVAGHAI